MLQTSRMVLGASSKLTLIAWGEGVPVAALFFKDTSAIIFEICYIFLEQAASIPDTTPCACVCCPFVLPTLLWSEKTVKC